jgi:amino acid transporter
MQSEEQEPLLSRVASLVESAEDYTSSEESGAAAEGTIRSIEDDVLPDTSTLGRTITWSSAYILVISRVIGSGIFATPGVIFRDVGSVGLSLSLWVVGAIIAACGLAVGLEYGCMLPRSGGEKVYLEFVYRKPRFLASTLVATQAVLLGFTASNCIVFAQYTLYAFNVEATDYRRKSLAVGLLTAITVVHSCFLKTGIRIQNFLGWIKIGLVIFMVLSGFFVVVFRSHGSEGLKGHFPAGSEIWKGSEWSWGIISTSLFKVFYSFAGLNNVNNVSSAPQSIVVCSQRTGHERSP